MFNPYSQYIVKFLHKSGKAVNRHTHKKFPRQGKHNLCAKEKKSVRYERVFNPHLEYRTLPIETH